MKGSNFVNLYGLDITERKQAEDRARQWQEQLTHASRLNTMGEMAAGIAHELNQPLATIMNYAEACTLAIQGGKASNDKLLDNLEEVVGQAGRAGEIIRRLRSFVRRQEPHRSSVDVNNAVREVVHFVESEAHLSGVQIRLDLATKKPRVLGDPIEIQQVILNLLRNALEAMDESRDGKRVLTVRTSSAENGAVEVSISDTGRGIPAEAMGRLFEPFQTTKPDGLGLGLAISRSIIEAHGGHLTATHNPDRGMTFRFTLSASDEV
jgi:two-component system sensor histidine kinase TtrS